MICSKIKTMIYLTIVVMLLFTPFLLDISPDGRAYAMGWLGSSAGSRSSGSGIAKSNTEPQPLLTDPGERPGTGSPAPVPEPATLLLFGAGAVGLAAFRKKFRKK